MMGLHYFELSGSGAFLLILMLAGITAPVRGGGKWS